MEEKSDDISILNTVSMCFNMSMNYSEFKMRLDIFGLDENDIDMIWRTQTNQV